MTTTTDTLKVIRLSDVPPAPRTIPTIWRRTRPMSDAAKARAISTFDRAVKDAMLLTKGDRWRALAYVAMTDPKAHRDFLHATNKPDVYRLIDDKFSRERIR